MSFIEVEHLKYQYPHTDKLALDDLSFSIEKGEFIGIIGENGAGKSTLSQAFMGLVPQFYKGAYGGSVIVDGLNTKTTSVSDMCQKVGLVFQNPFNQLSGAKDSVYNEIAFGLQNLAIEREEMHRRIMNALKLMDIEAFKDRNPFDLSGGQMQRVAIASILVMNPDVMILDEPTSQLDPKGSEEVFQAVDHLAKTGITIIMIEQKMEKMAAYCDRILLLHKAKQIDFDTPKKIFSRADLEQFGMMPPVFTYLCKKAEISDGEGTYPVSLEQVQALIGGKEQKLKTVIQQHILEKEENKKQTTEIEKRLFSIEHLDFQYLENTPIIQDLNLHLDLRSTAIIGQNGAGKTTLVKLLKGLLKPTAGSICFLGENIGEKTVATLAGQVGYVFQNPDDQIFKYHVLEEVMFGPLNIGMSKEEAVKQARAALKIVHLEEMEDVNPYDLELSQRKMVAIASVLAMNTDVVILDEPTIAMDAQGKRIIGAIIRELQQQGKLVIAILHDMDFVADYFDRVIVMTHGEILADGAATEVFKQEEVLQKACLMKPYEMALAEML